MPRNTLLHQWTTIVTPDRHILYISLQTEKLKNIEFFVLSCKIIDSNNLIGRAIRGATIYPMNRFGLVCHSMKIVGFRIRILELKWHNRKC